MPRKSAAELSVPPVDGRLPRLRPPASLSEAERKVFIDTVTACKPEHFRPSDLPLLSRYAEVVALSDHAAKQLRADAASQPYPPSDCLATQERLIKMLVTLGRQLRLSPMARQPNNPSRPQPSNVSGNSGVSAYERMRLEDDPA
jgi:hypothetical protein